MAWRPFSAFQELFSCSLLGAFRKEPNSDSDVLSQLAGKCCPSNLRQICKPILRNINIHPHTTYRTKYSLFTLAFEVFRDLPYSPTMAIFIYSALYSTPWLQICIMKPRRWKLAFIVFFKKLSFFIIPVWSGLHNGISEPNGWCNAYKSFPVS